MIRQEDPNSLALRIICDYFNQFAKREFSVIAEALGVSLKDVSNAVQEIKRLNPYPLNNNDDGETRYIAPELYVSAKDGELIVTPIQRAPLLSLSPFCDEYTKDAEIKNWTDSYLLQARNIISIAKQRQQTLLQIGRYIVEVQRAFFMLSAPQSVLTQEMVANGLNLSVSTVSRAINEKYLQFGIKVYPLKFFFTPNVSCGGSREQIMAVIRTIIKEENPMRPVSDGQIARYFRSKGQNITRRTITKYRQLMNIPPAPERLM